MEDLPFGRIAALVPEFAVKDLPLGRTLIMNRFSSNLVVGRRANNPSPSAVARATKIR